MATVTGLYNDYWSLPRVKPNYQAQIESFDKIAAYKNQQYEKAYSYINQLKQTTLSMDFMKKEYKDKMDTYNTELNELFKNKDLRSVDLSESKIANTYVGWFDKVANDKELIGAFKYEGKIKSEYARIKAGAQNPKKSGYADANFVVWQNAQGGLNDYLENDVDETFFSQPTPTYTPFYDVWKDINTLMSMAQESKDGQSYELFSEDGSTKTTISKKELREGKLQSLFGLMDAQAINQLKINEKAQFFKTLDTIPKEQQPQYFEKVKGNIINSENYIYQNNLKTQGESIAGLKADIAIYKAKNTPEALEKVKEYEATLSKYEREYNRYEVEGKPDVDNLTGLGKHEIAELYGNYNMQLQLMGFAAAFASSDEVIKSSPNESFWLAQNYNLDRAEFEHNAQFDYDSLAMKARIADMEAKGDVSGVTMGNNGLPVIDMITEGGVSEGGRPATNIIMDEIRVLDGLINSLTTDGKNVDFSTIPANRIIPIFYESLNRENTYLGDIMQTSSIAKSIKGAAESLGWYATKDLTKLTPAEQEQLKERIVNSPEIKRAANNDLILFKGVKRSFDNILSQATGAVMSDWNNKHSDEKITTVKGTDGKYRYVSSKTGNPIQEFNDLVSGQVGTLAKSFKYGTRAIITKETGGAKYAQVDLILIQKMNPITKGGVAFPIDGIARAEEGANSIRVYPKNIGKKRGITVDVGGAKVTWDDEGNPTIDNGKPYIEIPTQKDQYVDLFTKFFSQNDIAGTFTDFIGNTYEFRKIDNGFNVYVNSVKKDGILQNVTAVSEYYKNVILK